MNLFKMKLLQLKKWITNTFVDRFYNTFTSQGLTCLKSGLASVSKALASSLRTLRGRRIKVVKEEAV